MINVQNAKANIAAIMASKSTPHEKYEKPGRNQHDHRRLDVRFGT